MSGDDVVRVKGGVPGASIEVGIGRELPRVLARLFPTRAAKAQARHLVSGEILRKVHVGEALTDADAEYAATVLWDAEARWIRRTEIAIRAARIIDQDSPPELVAGSAEEDAATSEDWITRFWDDAELVSDSVLQEMYAQVLAGEARLPGRSSLRTLRVMRYLDRETAEMFGRLAPAVFDSKWIPRDDRLLSVFDLSFGLILELDDAGLIKAGSSIQWNVDEDPAFSRSGTRIISLENTKELSFDIYPLTKPGEELARVVNAQHKEEQFLEVARWMTMGRADLKASWAELPSPDYEGPRSSLEWIPLYPGSA